jgi:hypothetical protein
MVLNWISLNNCLKTFTLREFDNHVAVMTSPAASAPTPIIAQGKESLKWKLLVLASMRLSGKSLPLMQLGSPAAELLDFNKTVAKARKPLQPTATPC